MRGTWRILPSPTSEGIMKKLLLLSLLLLIPCGLSAQRVDERAVEAGLCSGTLISCPIYPRSSPAAGETVFVVVSWPGLSITVTHITDNLGDTYRPIVGPANAGGSSTMRGQVWYLKNTPSGITTFTATFSGNVTGNVLMWDLPMTGIDPLNPLDLGTVNSASGSSSQSAMSVASGTPSSSTSKEMMWGVFLQDVGGTPPTTGSGWTNASGAENYSVLEYKILNPASAQTATGTNNNGSNWIGFTFAFKASSG